MGIYLLAGNEPKVGRIIVTVLIGILFALVVITESLPEEFDDLPGDM